MTAWRARVLLLVLAFGVNLGCQTRRVNADENPQMPAAIISYGPSARQFAELRVPSGSGPFPVIVVIHGGCWVEYADVEYTAPLASALAREGWATWNLEYRRAHEEGGGWPGTFADVGAGVDALRDSAVKYKLDLDRVVVVGHSAGGQLALWAGGRKRVPHDSAVYSASPLPVRCVVALAGIADMRVYADRGPRGCAEATPRVMGGLAAQHPDRYAAVSPAELLPLGIPQVLVWGEEDTIVPERLFEAYEGKAKQSGDSVEILRVKGAGHHDLCTPGGPAWAQMVGAIRRLLGN